MKIFVVVPSRGHDGYGEPIGAYSFVEKAQEVVGLFERNVDGVFGAEIVELELDAEPTVNVGYL